MSTLNFSHPQAQFNSSQRMEFFSDFPIYDSFSVDRKSQSPERPRFLIDENTNYSSQLEEFPNQRYHHISLADSKYGLSNEGQMTESVYLTQSFDRHREPLTEQPINSERSGPVPLKPINRGVNEVKTETFRSPGRFLSPKISELALGRVSKENQVPILNLNKANIMISDSISTARLSQNVPDTVRISSRHYYPQATESPLISKIIHGITTSNEDPSLEACPSVESNLDMNEIMKLKDPFFGIHLGMMQYVIDELAGQEKEYQDILQIDRAMQGKPPNRKYYMIFNYNNSMDEEEVLSVIYGVKTQMEEIIDKLRSSQELQRNIERLKIYLIFGNSTGWLVIRQVYEINHREKRIGLKSKKYNPSNLLFDAKFRDFENRIKKGILEIISGPENLEPRQLTDSTNSFREKQVKFVTSWDSGIAVLTKVFKKFLLLSKQELSRTFLLYYILEKFLRTQKISDTEVEDSQVSLINSDRESR